MNMLHGIDHRHLAEQLIPHVIAAGREVMKQRLLDVKAREKADASPVTDADVAAENLISAAIRTVAPDYAIVAEESAYGKDATPLTATELARPFFLVDALDGTREYVSASAEFTINVALVADGKPGFGIVYAPALRRLYATVAADQAVLAVIDCEYTDCDQALKLARKIRTRETPKDGRKIVVSSYSHASKELEDWLETIEVAEQLRLGSSLKFCLVAEGRADLYPRFGPTHEWDTAAGHAVLSAAGGSVTCADGSPFLYGKQQNAFLNPAFVASGLPLV